MPLETREEREDREAKEANERALIVSDWAETLNTHAGYRTILRMIQALGGGNTCLSNEHDMTLHNVAIQFLQEIKVAHPPALAAMCVDLWGVPRLQPQQGDMR